MKIEIENYKNINSLKLELMDSKINFLYGVSGVGKSSIVNAVIGDKSEKNITYGKLAEDMKLLIEPKFGENDYLIFNEQTLQKLILQKEDSQDMYSIIFSNDNSLENIRKDISSLLSGMNSKRAELFDYVNDVDEMIKRINSRKLAKSGKFSSNSSIEKLKAEIINPKYKNYSNFIHNNGIEYVEWIEKGTQFHLFNQNKCPFCSKKLSVSRINKINNIAKIKPEQYKIISDSRDVLDKIGIEVPNFSYKREVTKLEKKLYDTINNKKIIIDMFNMIDSYNSSTLDINSIKKVVLSESLKKMFPDVEMVISEFNDSIKELKRKLGNIKLKTSKFIGKNIKKLNDYLSEFAIPYKFEIDNYNTKAKTATVFLISKKDEKHIDRIENLSYGEKNIISLLLFLVSANKNLIIIDDPASSYDDNRRKIIYDLLYEFHGKQTYVVLSHDQVFIKYALLGLKEITRKYNTNTGKILCLENRKGVCISKEISSSDFDSLENQIFQFIEHNQLSYYRKIINLRVLFELSKNSSNKDKLIYSYLSAIMHNTDRNNIIEQLKEEDINESDIIKDLKQRYNIKLLPIPEDLYFDFNYDELSSFEKIAYQREQHRIKREGKRAVKSYIEKEFDDIIHLNTRYFVSLNPYKFDVYSENIYNYI